MSKSPKTSHRLELERQAKAGHWFSPFCIYLYKVNNGNNASISKIRSKLTIKTQERCCWRRSGAFAQISHIILEFPLLTLNKKCWLILASQFCTAHAVKIAISAGLRFFD